MPSTIINRRVTITSVIAGAVYDPEAQALFDRMTVDPGTERKEAINNFFVGIKEDLSIVNLTDVFDCIWFTAAHDQQASRLNWVKNAHSLTEVNSPAWQLDRGYTDTTGVMYLDTNYNPFTQAVNYTLNNCSFGTYLRNETGANINISIGMTSGSLGYRGSQIYPRFTGDVFYSRVNSNDLATAVSTSTIGLFTALRSNATQHLEYKNGVVVDTAASASSSILSYNFYILAVNNEDVPGWNLTNNQVAFAYIANGSSINQLNLYNRVQTYLTVLGAQI